jgi:hypothetical protein
MRPTLLEELEVTRPGILPGEGRTFLYLLEQNSNDVTNSSYNKIG